MKTAEEYLKPIGSWYDGDGQHWIDYDCVLEAMMEYAQEVFKEQRRAELLKYTQWLENWILSPNNDLIDEYLKNQ